MPQGSARSLDLGRSGQPHRLGGCSTGPGPVICFEGGTMTHSILGRGASERRSVRPPSHQRRAVAAAIAAGVVGTTGLVMAPAHAADKGPFYAQEIFAPDHTPVVTAPCGRLVPIAGMAKPADLPAGT